MAKTFFIAGTDTGVGKTLVTAGLLAVANQQGLRTLGIKPLAAGARVIDGRLANEDALLLQQTSSVKMSYEQVNPVLLNDAVAPHIAAEKEGKRLSLDRLVGFCRGSLMQPADFKLIEGAGGWRVPLNSRENLSGLPKSLETPVILVIGMRLGCINQGLLTLEAIARDGIPIVGWISNQIDPNMQCYEENLQSLKDRIRAPMLAEIPYLQAPTPERIAQYIDLDLLSLS